MKKSFKVLAINASHRAERGNSEILMNRFLKGCRLAGAECEVLYPARMAIGPCRACYTCIFRTPGVCVQQDDMALILRKMEQADLLLLAVPVYFDTMPSGLKLLFDRFMPALGPSFEFREGRTYHLPTRDIMGDVAAILLCGNPERESLYSLQGTLRRVVTNMGGRLMGEFLFPSSQMVASHAHDLRGQLRALELAGEQAVRGGSISRAAQSAANKEYVIDFQADIAEKNRAFKEMMRPV